MIVGFIKVPCYGTMELRCEARTVFASIARYTVSTCSVVADDLNLAYQYGWRRLQNESSSLSDIVCFDVSRCPCPLHRWLNQMNSSLHHERSETSCRCTCPARNSSSRLLSWRCMVSRSMRKLRYFVVDYLRLLCSIIDAALSFRRLSISILATNRLQDCLESEALS